MIVRRYVVTFLRIMRYVLWRHSWKGDAKSYPTSGMMSKRHKQTQYTVHITKTTFLFKRFKI